MRLNQNLRRSLVTFGSVLIMSAASSPLQRTVANPTTGAGWLEQRQHESLLREKQWAVEARDKQATEAIDVILNDPRKWQRTRADLLAKLTNTPTSLERLDLPTRYEDPVAYTILKRAASIIQAGNATKVFSVRPVYGTSAGGTFHAVTQLVCPSDYAILFQRQLFSLARFFTTLLLAAERDAIFLRPDLIASLQNALLAYLLQGDLDSVELPRLTGVSESQAGFMLTVIEGFIFAHEYAHITRQHFKSCDSKEGPAVAADLRYDQAQEYEADGLALMQMLEWAEEKKLSKVDVFLAVDWQFAFQELIERAATVLITGSEEAVPDGPWSDSSHPYIRYRREYLLTIASKLLPQEEASLKIARQLASDRRYEMWQASRFKVFAARNEKKVISPRARR